MSTISFTVELATTLQRYFASLGLIKSAHRKAISEKFWHWLKVDNTDGWREPKFTSMMRSEPYLAFRLAKSHEDRYFAFGELLGAAGTRLDFRFWSDKTTLKSPSHRHQQSLIRKIRKVLRRLLPESINKIGAYRDPSHRYNRMVKVLYSKPITAAEFADIQSMLPPEVSVTRTIFPVSDFPAQLRAWAHADLPLDEIERADFELLIHGLQLTGYYRIPSNIRAKFALDTTPNANCELPSDPDMLLIAVVSKRRTPRSPKTGRLARFISTVVDYATRFEEIEPDHWMELPSTA